MKTPRQYVEGLRYANEFPEARSELLHLVVEVRSEAEASLRAEADEAWRALERIAERPCVWSLARVACGSEALKRWLGDTDLCASCIARAALALRSGVAPTTPDPKKGPTP